MKNLDALVETIRDAESDRRTAADKIRETAVTTDFGASGLSEDAFVHTVEKAELDDLTVAGIDGGLVQKAYHGVDIVMTRAVAAVFAYEDGTLAENSYVPSRMPETNYAVIEDMLDRSGVDRAASIQRLEDEVAIAHQTAETGVDVILMDGAIVPQFPDKPSKQSPLRERYEELLAQYRALYNTCRENDIALCGVVEDTRNTTMCELLADEGIAPGVLERSRDSHILGYVLEPGERTALYPYGKANQHPVLRDLEGYGEAINSCYLQTVRDDRPVRLDVFCPKDAGDAVDAAASVVYALAANNAGYGIPTVIIEADKRAKMEGHEVERVTGRIEAKLQHLSGTKTLRRDDRPF